MISWKKVPGFPNYRISSDGRVVRPEQCKGHYANHEMTQQTGHSGHRTVNLRNEQGRRVKCIVSRLMCLAFKGRPPTPQHQAAHRDGNPKHNVLRNLYWATPVQNMKDRDNHGRTARFEQHGGAKLTGQQVRAIRRKFTGRHGQYKQLSREFGVSDVQIRNIVLHKKWARYDTVTAA